MPMAEHHTRQYNTCHSQIETDIIDVGNDALEYIDTEYGSGYPLWTPGNNELPYHNGHHGRSVGKFAVRIASRAGLSGIDLAIIRAVGEGHDIFQGPDHELKSAAWVSEEMRKKGVPRVKRQMARLVIYGTIVTRSNGKIIQRATQMSYPSLTAEIATKSVACGDLALYQPESPLLAHHLLREFLGLPPTSTITHAQMLQHQRHQAELLEGHQYPLKEAREVLEVHKPAVLDYTYAILGELETGRIETFSELIERDERFLATCR